jgi:predicted DNA-binding transcriptional regulator YafY
VLRQLERILKLDTLLRSPARHTQTELAIELEVSVRTIRTDFDFLRDRLEAPLCYTRQRGWHYTDPGWTLPTIPLSEGEMIALTMGAQILQAYTGSALQAQLEQGLQRLIARLPEETQVSLQSVLESRLRVSPGAELSVNTEIWQKLQLAVQLRRMVKIRYFAASHQTEQDRIVDPYLVFFRRTNPYLVGYCHARLALRDFRIDRIRRVELLKDSFEPDPQFDAESYLNSPFLHTQGGVVRVVKIHFQAGAAPYIRERYWHHSQQLEEQTDGSLIFSVEAKGLEEVKRWVLFYGAEAQVLEPQELVEMLKNELGQMEILYNCD